MQNKIFFIRTIIGFLPLLFFTIFLNAQSLFLFHDFSLSEHPGINKEVVIFSSFEPVQNEKLIRAKILLPNNVKLISGDSIWTGSAKMGQVISFSTTIMFSDTGNYKLQLSVKKNYDSNKWAGNIASYFLHVGLQNGSKGWKKYYNKTGQEVIEGDSAYIFNKKIFLPDNY